MHVNCAHVALAAGFVMISENVASALTLQGFGPSKRTFALLDIRFQVTMALAVMASFKSAPRDLASSKKAKHSFAAASNTQHLIAALFGTIGLPFHTIQVSDSRAGEDFFGKQRP